MTSGSNKILEAEYRDLIHSAKSPKEVATLIQEYYDALYPSSLGKKKLRDWDALDCSGCKHFRLHPLDKNRGNIASMIDYMFPTLFEGPDNPDLPMLSSCNKHFLYLASASWELICQGEDWESRQ